MKLHVIFGQRACSYEGEYAPEVIDCWDCYTVDENPDGFDEAVAKAKARTVGQNPEFASVAVIDVEVNGTKVHDILNKNPVLKGQIGDVRLV